jgi:hypothetical protein
VRHFLPNLSVSDTREAPADDQAVFRTNFEESIRNKSELVTYVRLQCNGIRLSYSEDVLFEIRGYPPECEADGDYFFVVAKPYPSRNVAMWAFQAFNDGDLLMIQLKVEHLLRTQEGE